MTRAPSLIVFKALPIGVRTSIVLGPILLWHPAQAQLFNQILPAEIYGTADQPDVTVGSRVHEGYDNGGIRAGDFIIRPRLTESVGFETNVLGTPHPVGSPLIDTSASLDASSNGPRRNLSASLSVDNSQLPSVPNQSFTTYSARLGGSYNLGHDTATLTVSHDNQVQTPQDLDVPTLSAPLAVVVDRIRAGYRAVINRLSLTPDIEIGRYTYNSGQVGSTVYDQSYRNRIVTAPGVTAAYEFATRRSIVLVLRDTIADYARGSIVDPKRNFNDSVVMGGVDYDVNGFLRTRLLVGYERRTFTSTTYATLAAPIAELTLIYNPTELTTLTATVTRRIQDSSDETTAGVTSTSGQFKIDHELRRNVILGASGGVTRYDYAATLGGTGATEQTLATLGVSATYLLNRYASAGASYGFTARTGTSTSNTLSLNGLPAGGNYVDHRFLLQIKLGL